MTAGFDGTPVQIDAPTSEFAPAGPNYVVAVDIGRTDATVIAALHMVGDGLRQMREKIEQVFIDLKREEMALDERAWHHSREGWVDVDGPVSRFAFASAVRAKAFRPIGTARTRSLLPIRYFSRRDGRHSAKTYGRRG